LQRILKEESNATLLLLATGALACLGEMIDLEKANLTKLLKLDDWTVRFLGCQLLGRLKLKSAIPELKKLLTQDNLNVRHAAKAALAAMAAKEEK
jgi:HEAT repeat protein